VALHFPVVPMKATLGDLPPAAHDDEWAYEIKWDGYRTLAFVDDGKVRLQSSNSLDVTVKYPELRGFAESVNAPSAIIDGELVVLDANGRPNFGLLQQHTAQVVFHPFDVLQIAGTDTVSLPYEQRRALLESLVEPGSNWMVPAYRIGDGAALYEVTAAQGMEGIMAKRLGSPYLPGKRSPNWRKVKHRLQVEVIVGGFNEGTGNRSNTFGALLVGVPDDDGSLRFAGGVGTGFDQKLLESLSATLHSLATRECPFNKLPPKTYLAGATWVRPELRALVEIAEFTNDGNVRHASFIRLLE
jgi:bifunctional non-homologous end joining protein LigD